MKKLLVLIFGCIYLINPTKSMAAFTNMVSNSGFEENNLNGWQVGNLNRAIYPNSTYPGAYQGNYWLDVSDCPTCQDTNGLGKSIVFDITEKLVIGQRYQASIYFRSPNLGSVEFVAWGIGGETEIFSSGVVRGDSNWKKIEVNIEIKKSGHNSLRLQVFLKNDITNKQFQFDELSLVYKPWIIGHRYLYHHIPSGLYWSGKYSSVFEGWVECYTCGGRPDGLANNKDADPRKIIGPEPWRREIGTGDGISYPYLGIYDDSNVEMVKYQAMTQKNAGIDGWAIGFWSDALPRTPATGIDDGWYYKPLVQLKNEYSPYFESIDFKFYAIDEMVYNWSLDNPPDTQRMKDHAITLLKTFKSHKSYLRINGLMVYYLPMIDKYKTQNRIGELKNALQSIETAVGEKIYWLGYTGSFDEYYKWKDSGINAFFDGYGLTGSIFDDKNTEGKIADYSRYSLDLADNNMGMVMTSISAFMTKYFNGDTSRTYTRKNGERWNKSLDVMNGIKPAPVIFHIHEAEWQEGKMIEPCTGWRDETSTDPFKYLKVVGQKLKGITYSQVTLPPAKIIDPLRAGEVYGRDSSFMEANIATKAETGKNIPVLLRVKNTGEAPWTRQTLTYGEHGWYRMEIKFNNQTKYVDLSTSELIEKDQEKIFSIGLIAPNVPGQYELRARMIQNGFTGFGEEIVRSIDVLESGTGCIPIGEETGINDLIRWYGAYKNGTENGDLNCDGNINIADLIFWNGKYKK